MHRSESVNSKISLSYLILGVFAVLLFLPFDFPFRHLHEHAPRYDTDDHDVCRANGWLFALLMVWYMSLLASLLFNSHTFSQTWAQRLLMYPNLAVGIIGLFGTIVVFGSYYSHSEKSYSMSMGALNGMLLGVIVAYSITIVRNPLAEGLRYAWNILAITTGGSLTANILLSFWEEQWYLVLFSLVALVPFAMGMLETQKLATKKPYSF